MSSRGRGLILCKTSSLPHTHTHTRAYTLQSSACPSNWSAAINAQYKLEVVRLSRPRHIQQQRGEAPSAVPQLVLIPLTLRQHIQTVTRVSSTTGVHWGPDFSLSLFILILSHTGRLLTSFLTPLIFWSRPFLCSSRRQTRVANNFWARLLSWLQQRMDEGAVQMSNTFTLIKHNKHNFKKEEEFKALSGGGRDAECGEVYGYRLKTVSVWKSWWATHH